MRPVRPSSSRDRLPPIVWQRQLRRAAALMAVLVVAGLQGWRGCRDQPADEALAPGIHDVRRVVDGDTLLMHDGRRLRLLGVDTPETVKPDHAVEPWGPEATDFTRRFIARGDARLEFDRERQDRFGRWLAYVWIGDEMLNEELLRAGLARWEPHFAYSQTMKTRFRKAQHEAQEAHRGLWSGRSPTPHPTTNSSKKY